MPTLLGEAVDPTLGAPFPLWATAGSLTEPVPSVPPPTPGDPDVEYVTPGPIPVGIRVQVMVSTAVRRLPIGELTTALVEDWDEDVELLAGSTASITASASDPLFAVMATRSWTGSDGRLKHEWDPKGYVVTVYLEGRGAWTGVFRQPIDIGGGRVLLPASDPSSVLAERFLGRAEQLDLYDGWGDFESVPLGEEPPGLLKSSGDVTAQVVLDAVRGVKCLQVQGRGYVDCPRVGLPGQAETRRSVEGAAFGKWSTSTRVGIRTIMTITKRADLLAPSDLDTSEDKAGARPDCGSDWSQSPVASGALMDASPLTHWSWVRLYSYTPATRYDVVTLRQGILTGFLEPTDLARYVERVLRDLNSASLGGSPTGLTSRIESLTGTTAQMTWAHNTQPAASEVLRMVLEAEGGPECRITPGWVLVTAARLGSVRNDVALTMHNVPDPSWSVDAGAQVDDYIADTGRGTGTSLLAVTVSQPYDPDRHRVAAMAPAPVDMPLNAVSRWAQRHARPAARIQRTAEVDVDWETGMKFVTGDEPWASLHAGDQGLDQRVRVINRRFRPSVRKITLTLGAAS